MNEFAEDYFAFQAYYPYWASALVTNWYTAPTVYDGLDNFHALVSQATGGLFPYVPLDLDGPFV